MSIAAVERGPWHGLDIGAGRYRNLTTLGEGGMGFVYRALDANLKTQVVIKSPRPAQIKNSNQIGRFEREIGALVKLSFPQIVPISDVGRYNGIPFAVMRYLSGGSLADRMRPKGALARAPMPVASLKTWLGSIAKALDFVHLQKYVHRDVKPSNILFDQHGQAYLSDFGIIQVLGDRSDASNQHGMIMGTVDYLAPELIAGKGCDGRADQYALAVTVYEALAGELPFGKLPLREVAAAQVGLEPPPLSKVAAHVPPAISAAVRRGLAKSPQQRFRCCTDFALEILRAIAAPQPSDRATPLAGGLAPPSASPDSAARDTAPVASAPTKSQPRFPSSQADRNQATSVIAVQRIVPVQHGKTPANSPAPRRRSNKWLLPACIAVAVAAVGMGIAMLPRHSTQEPSATESPHSAAELGRRIENWTDRLHAAEKSIMVDSRPLLSHPQYGSAAELAELVSGRAKRPLTELRQKLDGFERELSDLGQLDADLAADVDKSLTRSSPIATETDSARNSLRMEQRSLKEQGSAIAGCRDRLTELRRVAESPTASQDEAVSAELAALREMENSGAARRRIDVSQATLQRATELVHATNGKLAATSLVCLARSPDPIFNRVAIRALTVLPAGRQADVCWSLLLSGERGAIVAAAGHLESHGGLAASFKIDDVLDLAEEAPDSYEPLLGVVAAWLQSPAQRERLFRLQAPRMIDEWAIEIEQSCKSGALRDRVPALLAEILDHRWTASYRLASRLLDLHPTPSLDALSVDGLSSWCAADPQLGNKLVQRLLARGKPAQRDAALGIYLGPGSSIDDAGLFQFLRDTSGPDSVGLLNRLLSSTDAKSLQLAEVVLEGARNLAPREVAYDTVSDAAAERKRIRDPLLALAGQSNGVGRAWTLKQLLGRQFVDQLTRVEADRVRQLSAIKSALAVLDNPLVDLPGGDASGDRGLVTPTAALKTMPTDLNPVDWKPDGKFGQTVVGLRARIAEVGVSAPPMAGNDLRLIDKYLDSLQRFTNFSFDMAEVYEAVITKQIAGANRQLNSRPARSWTFRFFKESLDVFRRRRDEYETLTNKSDEARTSLPDILK
ncbi:MAG TPA: protein kinase [Pirellulales bacterium]|nr:protein kinase [Pirellulales bacterium]